VDRADEARPKNVGEIRGHGREASAVHRENDAERGDEQSLLPGMGQRRRGGVEQEPEAEENEIGRLPPDMIRQRSQKNRPAILNSESSPTKPAAIVAMAVFWPASSAAKPVSGWPISAPPKISCSIGEAIASTPMPAETLRHSTAQISQNCGVL